MASHHTVHPPAYYKAVFHSARHPSSSVLGVLLGTAPSPNQVEVVDAVPLVHHWTSLGMAVEAGLGLVDAYARVRGQQMVGVYAANARLDDRTLSRTAIQVLEALRRGGCPSPIALLLDTDRLAKGEPAFLPFVPSSPDSSTWSPVPSAFPPPPPSSSSRPPSPSRLPQFSLSDASLPTSALAAVRRGDRHKSVADFDDHLEDVGADWLENREVLIGLVKKDV